MLQVGGGPFLRGQIVQLIIKPYALPVLAILGFTLFVVFATGCSGSVGTTRTVYVGQAPTQQPVLAQQPCPFNGVYSCARTVQYVPYFAGYQAPPPQYGPYGYSARMTAKVTPAVYVRPSAPKRVVKPCPPRRR